MRGSIQDVKELLKTLDRMEAFDDSYNRVLIEDAIFNMESGSEYRAEKSLSTAMYNLRKSGNSRAADAIERVL